MDRVILQSTEGKLPRANVNFSKLALDKHKLLSMISDKSKRILKEREEMAIAVQDSNATGKRIEETLPHSKRIEIIYLSLVHGISIRKTAAMTQSHYSTVRSVKEAFKSSGRTNKLLTYQSKALILKQRKAPAQKIVQDLPV